MTYQRGSVADVRRPRRRDDDDIFAVVAALFAALPPWAPLVAIGVGDGATALAFTAFGWPTTLRPTALFAVTLFFRITEIGGLLEAGFRVPAHCY